MQRLDVPFEQWYSPQCLSVMECYYLPQDFIIIIAIIIFFAVQFK